MRDRRNTHRASLSISSSSSSDSASTTPARNSLSEKDLERQLDESCVEEETIKEHKRDSCRPHSLIFYRRLTALLIALFVAFNLLSSDIFQAELQPTNAGRPSVATAIPVTDKAGKARWTVSIPSNISFPLSTREYDHICQDAARLGRRPTRTFDRLWRPSASSIARDPTYMDVDEAQSLDLVPAESATGTCDSSLTLTIDPNEASFGKTLMLIWLSYGLARRDGRAFFLDDSHWAYGSYESYFPPLPRPACARPPASHIVPCPLQAKHVIITASTAGQAFEQALGPRKREFMFDIARIGYEASFKLIGEDASYAQDRLRQLRDKARADQQPLIGMHIRRGDLHPFELEYSQDYLPLEKFTDAAKHMLRGSSAATLMLSSDDPDIVESSELKMVAAPHTLARSQERIQLATKLALDRTAPARPIREPGSAYTKHIDENAGWDGGFYTALFNSIGDQRRRSEQHLLAAPPSKDGLRMKELIGRGYLLDLEILSQADGVVCAVSSAACRLLGVMMGREAMVAKRWVNIDDNRAWSWDGSR